MNKDYDEVNYQICFTKLACIMVGRQIQLEIKFATGHDRYKLWLIGDTVVL